MFLLLAAKQVAAFTLILWREGSFRTLNPRSLGGKPKRDFQHGSTQLARSVSWHFSCMPCAEHGKAGASAGAPGGTFVISK